MSADRLRRVEELYHAALAQAPEVRGAFVAEACGADESLRRELASLLQYAAGSEPFLDPAIASAPRLTSGQSLGHYEVIAPLGAGGMGEVYRARDTVLGRDVAIKVLPFAVSGDPERLRRFEREARAAAALTHPNIVTIHSVEHEADVHFLTMELVDGAPLSERIPRDGLSLNPFLDLAIALADAVAAAHARGIVHRDLKPANVIVAADGRVKVLDFGLAKLRPLVEGVDLTNVPASTSLTGDGRLLGTVAYMSPEQAEGRDVDHRSDIFSLGVMLYELATGERPFSGETSLGLLSSIVKSAPRSISDVKPDYPAELSRIVGRCLVKEPGRRYQSAIDLRNHLEELRQESASGSLTMAPVEIRSSRLRRTVQLVIGAAVVVGVGAAGVAVGRGPFARDVHGVPRHLEILTHDAQVVAALGGREIALSPDGRRLALLDRGRIYVRKLDEPSDAIVPAGESHLASVVSPFFSPDGKRLAYSVADRSLEAVWVDGADKAQKLCDHSGVGGGTWVDEKTVIFSDIRSLWVATIGGDCHELKPARTNPGGGVRASLQSPQLLPGGERLLVEMREGGTPRAAVVSRTTGEVLRVVESDAANPRYVASGHLVFVRGRTLFAAPFDVTAMQTTATASPALNDVFVDGLGQFDVSGDGTLAYVAARADPGFRLVWVDRRTRAEQPIDMPPDSYWAPRLSPDGHRLAVVRSRPAEKYRFRIDLVDLRTGAFDFLANGVWPEWLPDGRSIAFTTYGALTLVRRPVDRRDAESVLLAKTFPALLPSFSRRPIVMSFQANAEKRSAEAMRVMPLDPPGADDTEVLVTSAGPAGYLSPDARYLSYASDDESGNGEVYVTPCRACRPDLRLPDMRWHVSNGGGAAPRWSPDGKEIFYLKGTTMMSVRVRTEPDFSYDAPQILFDGADYVLDQFGNRNYDVSADGQRFVMVKRGRALEDRHRIELVINWFDELRAKVPGGGR